MKLTDRVQLTDTCIKNGGDHFLLEVASKEFVDELSNLIKATVSNSYFCPICSLLSSIIDDYPGSQADAYQILSTMGPCFQIQVRAILLCGSL